MKILLVRLRQIGDVVFTTPAVAVLRRRFPGAHLSYLVEPPAAPVVLANPHLTEVIVAPRRGGMAGAFADLRLAQRLRKARFDLAIDFHGGPRASLLTWLSGAPRRIGYNIVGRSWMYTDVVDRPRTLRRRHSVENQWDLLRALDIPAPSPAANPIEVAVDDDAARRVDERLAAAGIEAGDQVAVIHVSASSPFRRWPASSFVATVVALASGPHRRVVVTSGPADREAARGIIEQAREALPPARKPHVLDIGDFSLPELRALLDRSAVYIGGDSGPLHLAAATAIPIVAIFGPTPSERSSPWRNPGFPAALIEVDGLPCRPCDQRVCEPGDFRCLTGIDAARVIEAAERLLAAPRRPAHADVR